MAIVVSANGYFEVDTLGDLASITTHVGSIAKVISTTKYYHKQANGWKSNSSWEIIGQAVLASPAESIVVTFAARKYIRMFARVEGKSSSSKSRIRFNADSGANYSFRIADDTSTLTGLNQSGVDLSKEATANVEFWEGLVHNPDGKVKRFFHGGPFDGDVANQAPKLQSARANYAVAVGQITSATIDSGTAGVNLLAGTEMVVWGRDED